MDPFKALDRRVQRRTRRESNAEGAQISPSTTVLSPCTLTLSSAKLHLPAALSKAVLKLMEQVHAHTEIIDCGELNVDNNRWIWDSLTVFKKIIYKSLDDRA